MISNILTVSDRRDRSPTIYLSNVPFILVIVSTKLQSSRSVSTSIHERQLKFYSCQISWLKENGFGGWMVWAIDLDDFNGSFCGGQRYPLVSYLRQAIDN
jgi:hypothetical protein